MPEKLKLDLPIVLPDIDSARDRCVGRLVDDLQDHAGVSRAHVITGDQEQESSELCVHYDPEVVDLGQIRRLARRDGARLTDRFGHLIWQVEGIDHARLARKVGRRLEQVQGIVEASASPWGTLRVEYDQEEADEERVREAVALLGLTIVGETGADAGRRHHDHDHNAEGEHKHEHDAEDEHEGHGHGHGHAHAHSGVFAIFGERTELIFALLAGAAVILGEAVNLLTGAPAGVPIAIFSLGYVFGGALTVREAYETIRSGRFEIEFLMLVAAAGAAALGAFFEGALLLFLFSLGHSLEHYAMGRATKAIEALAELAPKTAIVRRGEREEEVDVGALELGDVVIVRPNQKLPADGYVLAGTSTVDQAPITGESIPVEKQPVADRDLPVSAADRLDSSERVFAGTINGAGALEIRVTKRASDNTIARVVQLVSEAETQKSPTQRFTDRFERYFVPTIITFVVLLIVSPLVTGENFADSFYRAMAVLVAASPCALAIATPSAVLSAVARAGRSGVLVKGGGPLETLGTLRAIAFDKTGTLTVGRPQLTDVVTYDGADENELLRTARAVESLSDHPLAAAVVRDIDSRNLAGDRLHASALESVTGRGVKATISGQPVEVGKRDLFSPETGPCPEQLVGDVDRLEAAGRTTMIIRKDGRFMGALGLMDTPRASAAPVVRRLRSYGIRRMIMISGDNQRVAEAIASDVGVDEAWGDLMPEDKVRSIEKLRESEGKAAMVGDGVNDAPAMANASVGIAMGAAGSDVALETADVALMADDLERLPLAVGLSRATSRIIKQNLIVSLGVVAMLVPATVLGLGIGPAVFFHEGSTLVVVFNALRLLAFPDDESGAR